MVGRGRYLLQDVIGVGSGTTVRRALDRKTGEVCAVKLHPPFHDEARRARFLEESKVMAMIAHPHVVRTREAGRQDGFYWIAMDLLPAGDLAAWVTKHGAVPVDEACRFLLEVLLGLSVVHKLGVVHRDVKPHNVFLDEDGRAVLGDFGVARHVERDTFRTDVGASMGTPGYRAPEQINGAEAAEVGADIYGAGATLYRISTNRRPDYLHGAEAFYPEVLEPVPPALLPIVLRACRFNPEDRYPSCEAMAADLAAVRDEALGGAGLRPDGSEWMSRFSQSVRPGWLQRLADWFDDW